MDTKITIEALNKANKKQKPNNELIINSDRKTQYISKLYRKKVKKLGLLQSFSSKGNPYDNAAIESFHAILKKEEVHHRKYMDLKKLQCPYFNLLKAGLTEIEYTAA